MQQRNHLRYTIILPMQVLGLFILSIFGLQWALTRLDIGHEYLLLLSPIRDLGCILCLTWIYFRWKKTCYEKFVLRRLQGHFPVDEALLGFLNKLLTILGVLVAGLCVLHVLGLNILPLVAFGGIGAASVAFASKDVCSNFFSGLMLQITRPFVLHDQVELPQRKVIGHIEEIGWCLTMLRDIHKRPIYLPNSVFSQEILINVSRITHRFIEETIRWRYADSKEVALAVEEMRQLLDTHPDIDHEMPVYVFLKTITTTYAEMEIKAYTRKVAYEEFMTVKQDILLKRSEIVKERTPCDTFSVKREGNGLFPMQAHQSEKTGKRTTNSR